MLSCQKNILLFVNKLLAAVTSMAALLLASHAIAGTMTKGVLIDTNKPSDHSSQYDAPMEPGAEQEQVAISLVPIIIRVTGYGTYDRKHKSAAAKKLKAIRASRLDAYRNLAERVYGFSVTGSSSVKDFMLDSDQFATTVDSVVRGARVISISDNPDTGIETVVELELPGDFQSCLNKVNNFRYRSDCMRPMTATGISAPDSAQIRDRSREPRMRALYHLD